MTTPISDQRILVGVTGSIACYKAADLASKLRQAGGQVDVILSPAAIHFITPLTFQSVTGRKAYTENDLWGSEGHVLHIGLADGADLMVIAPATANTIAKLAQGIADNLLTLTALAADCPLVIAPAMDGGMYAHPATQANLETLKQRGATIIGPAEGPLASGQTGLGRMVEPGELLGHIRRVLGRQGPLQGLRVVVTAGGTREPLDPVRALTNRSSGKQGYALAQAALDLGADVSLVSAPTTLVTPIGAQRVDVITAQEMHDVVLEAITGANVLIMAAAVADFRPTATAIDKIKKEAGIPEVILESTPDILSAVAQRRSNSDPLQLVIGFAAESKDLLRNAQRKLKSKKLDLIVANDILDHQAGFTKDTNKVTILWKDGRIESLPLMTKAEVAQMVLKRVCSLLEAHGSNDRDTS